MNRCGICGKPGNWLRGICDTCQQTKALEERNRIDKDRLRSEEEQRKREQRLREEQQRQDRIRDEREQRLREEQLRQDRIRDEQEQRLREEQLRQDRELREEQLRIEQEREAHLRAIEAQEEADRMIERLRNQIAQQLYEDEQKAREWAERKKYLDCLSDAEVKNKFEGYLSDKERGYLESRYRCCLSKEDELEFVKDKEKFVEKKRIKNEISSTSDEAFIYSYISTLDTRWFEEIIERENYLKEFPQINYQIPSELEKEYQNAENAEQRKKIVGMSAYIIRLKNKLPIDRQIYFRDYIQDHWKYLSKNSIDGETLDFDDALGLFWGVGPVLKDESNDAVRLFWNSNNFTFYLAKCEYLLFSKLEPLYLEALKPEERDEYLEKKKSAEKEGEEFLKKQKEKDQEEQEKQKEKEREEKKLQEEYQREFDEKKNENKKLVAECDEINIRRENRPLLYEKNKKSRKNTIKIGCITPFVILLIVGMFIKADNRPMNAAAGIVILVVVIFALIRTILLSIKMKNLLKEEVRDNMTQNEIVEKSKQLVARLDELQKVLSK